MVMAQNLLDDNFSESGNNVVTSNEGEHLNKCNQCQYASSVKSSLRRHLKMHSGEKSNKCNLCDFASSQKSQLNIEYAFENAQWRKAKQMQPM